MTQLLYCKNCKATVQPTTYGVGWGILTMILLFAFVIPGLIVAVWRFMDKDKCPACKQKNFTIRK